MNNGRDLQKISCCETSGPIALQIPEPAKERRWVTGAITTVAGRIPVAATRLTLFDHLSRWRVRWGIGRMSFSIPPGLYAVGRPEAASPVFVSANFKMSFDRLRSRLAGLDGWILVLDTKGINVWCAAGKGTFGTAELVHRIRATNLQAVVSHRKLIVPQLGATGVSSFRVKAESGFRVIFGPVRAGDLPRFLQNGMKADAAMRRVLFPLWERLVLTPIEVVVNLHKFLLIAVIMALLSGLGSGGSYWDGAIRSGGINVLLLSAAYLTGTVLIPVLLPWIPARSFAAKGGWIGMLLVMLIGWGWLGEIGSRLGWLSTVAWAAMIPALISFLSMNFTGCSTYTSLSGVRREMKYAVPFQIGLSAAGLLTWVTGLFIVLR